MVSLFLCVTPLVTDPTPKYFIAVGSVILAAIVYFFIIYKRYQPKWMSKLLFYFVALLYHMYYIFVLGKVNFFIQVVLEVTPPGNNSPESSDLPVDKKSSEKQS